ncbi:hypothetical protein E4U52_000731 [Claviceps spartinae]|nr:hypothetical protein E4U52_000731 [Claviceps spartinae]
MGSPASDSMYDLQYVPGKGQGLVATRNILKGTRILSEQPFFTITYVTDVQERQRLICQQVDSLSNHQRDAFLSMHNAHPFNDAEERYAGIFQTNCLPAGGDSPPYKKAIYLQASRINHSCENNELTVPYVLYLKKRESRQRNLKAAWGFTCLCRLCSLPDEQSQERDQKLEQIIRLRELCESARFIFPLQALRYCHAQMCLYREIERGQCHSVQVYEFAVGLTVAYGDLARTRVFALKAASVWTTLTGNDSLRVSSFTAMALHATNDPLYGFSMEWKTAVDDIPQALEPNDFENWLWKRQIPEGQGQPKSLAFQPFFTGFFDLPYTKGEGPGDNSNKRHWCFLGEILGSEYALHLGLTMKDLHGDQIAVHLYTKGRGKELMPSQYQRGYTVAILDPLQYFNDGDFGIRLENPQMIKGCQMVGWTTKAHKGDCKFLRDPDLRGLFLIKWNEVQDCVRFPLRVADVSI